METLFDKFSFQTIVTDLKSVAFIYDKKSSNGKIKNDKIQRWKIELCIMLGLYLNIHCYWFATQSTHS